MTPNRTRPHGTLQAIAALAFVALSGCFTPHTAPHAPLPRTVDNWRELADSDAAPDDLGTELIALTPLFANPDPAIRDELAYGLATKWILGTPGATPDDLRRVLPAWTAGMRVPRQDSDENAALGRSFSALALALIAARDLRVPFLDPAEHRALLDAALTYLAEEPDERGLDETVGWVHAAAHTADLIKFLGASPLLTPAGQSQILIGLASRARRPQAAPFSDGEDVRIAKAVGTVLLREDVDAALGATFVNTLLATVSPAAVALAPTPAPSNELATARALDQLLEQAPASTPAIVAARERLRAELRP